VYLFCLACMAVGIAAGVLFVIVTVISAFLWFFVRAALVLGGVYLTGVVVAWFQLRGRR
jgi:hypothetical protein